jgi:peptidoglycan hydrolase-like protein with peptidoglycan-binding domain
MHTWVTVLIVSVLWMYPMMIAAGTAGTPGEPPPEQQQLITKDNVKLIQERLTAEGVYAGPVDGEVNTQTEAALRVYQQNQGLPVSGAADEATLRELQIRLPASRQGEGAQ